MDRYELFQSIRRGDIKKIAHKTGYCRHYIGRILSPAYGMENERVISTAKEVIKERQNTVSKIFIRKIESGVEVLINGEGTWMPANWNQETKTLQL